MKKVERKARKRVKKLIDKWLIPLGLGWWQRIGLVYSADRASFERKNGDEVVMIVNADWRYKAAVVTVNCHKVIEMSKDYLESVFLHEMAHIMLDELDVHDDHEERICTNLSQVFRWLWLAGEGKFDR